MSAEIILLASRSARRRFDHVVPHDDAMAMSLDLALVEEPDGEIAWLDLISGEIVPDAAMAERCNRTAADVGEGRLTDLYEFLLAACDDADEAEDMEPGLLASLSAEVRDA